MTAEPMIDQQGLTAALMSDLVVGNVSGLLQEASRDCPSTAHADWCYREALRTLARYAGVVDAGQMVTVLTDIAMLFDRPTVARVLEGVDDAEGEAHAA